VKTKRGRSSRGAYVTVQLERRDARTGRWPHYEVAYAAYVRVDVKANEQRTRNARRVSELRDADRNA